MAFSAYEFWQRIDALRGDSPLTDLAIGTGIKYQQIRHLRSENRFPKAEELILIANYYDVTVEALTTADNQCSSVLKPSPRVSAIIERINTANDLELAMVEKILGIGG